MQTNIAEIGVAVLDHDAAFLDSSEIMTVPMTFRPSGQRLHDSPGGG